METTECADNGQKQNDDGEGQPFHKPAATKAKQIVVKKKKAATKKHNRTRARTAMSAPSSGIRCTRSVGLPSFRPRVPVEDSAAAAEVTEELSEDLDGMMGLPSDTFLAIQSLLQESRGLHIPLLHGNGTTDIQILLESQIFQRFQQDHASTTWSELRQLIQSNQIKYFTCHQGGTASGTIQHSALILTNHYVRGVKDAQEHHSQRQSHWDTIVEWFVTDCLKHWKGCVMAKSTMEDYWNGDLFVRNGQRTQRITLEDAIRCLMRIQVLLRDSSSSTNGDECFVLWLPQWGLVLKQWHEARQQLLGVVARGQGGEISERNLLSKNRHANISTIFLLDELKQQGLIQIVPRPFGRFVKRAPTTSSR